MMNLKEALSGISHQGDVPDVSVRGVTCDSKSAGAGMVFVCIKGVRADGHDFAKKAMQSGCAAVVAERDLGLKGQVLVANSHEAYAKMCANFAGNPAGKLHFIGVTGTNGKTTVTSLIKQILTQLGFRVGLIGTIQNEIGHKVLPTDKTTPDPAQYQALLQQMAEENCDYVVMEVSSHALDQCRLADTHFDVAAFTNLTQDHLDYHGTMEQYYLAKRKLFDRCDQAVVCVDDSYGARLAGEIPCKVTTFCGDGGEADFSALDVKTDVTGVRFTLSGKGVCEQLSYETPGMFSVHNAMTAVLCCFCLSLPLPEVAHALSLCAPVKGRSERIPTGRDFTVICDYAHSPDGLKNILDSIKSYKTGRVVTLFGCGGDRDRAKRPLMGEVAAKYSDFLIVTSDNPRTEDPDGIIDEILTGVQAHNTPYVRITDRRQAIDYAISYAQPNDIILLAGKGHEDYQVLGTKKVHLDEREVVKEALGRLGRARE